MNFLYCRPEEYFLETELFIDTFSIPIDGSMEVDEDDLIALMDDIANFAGDNYYADLRSEKAPFMFDINLVSGAPQGYINIESIFLYEGGSVLTTIDQYPYEDSWLYGQYSQDASEFCSEEEANADAADLFRRDLRMDVVYRNKYGDGYYFRDPYYVCFSPGSTCTTAEIPHSYYTIQMDEEYGDYDLLNIEDEVPQNNLFDYYLFSNYTGYPYYNTCLAIDEMNFYYENMKSLALEVLPNPVDDYVISQIEVGYLYFLDEFETAIFHSMIVVRAIKVDILDEEYEEAIALPYNP